MQALIVADPGRFRDGLRSLLVASAEVETIEEIQDPLQAPDWVRLQPDSLAIFFPNGGIDLSLQAIRAIKAQNLPAFCLAIVSLLSQSDPFMQAGADLTLLKGFSSTQLFYLLHQLNEDGRPSTLTGSIEDWLPEHLFRTRQP